MFRRVCLPVLVLFAVFALVACGDGSKIPAASAVDRVDFNESLGNLQYLTSFRFDLSLKVEMAGDGPDDAFGAALLGALGDIRASGAVVAPDRAEMDATMFGQKVAFVQIGSRAWMKTGSTWQSTRADAAPFGTDFDDFMTEFLPDNVVRVAKTSREKVNGVQTVRYSFDKKALAQIASDLGESADLSQVDTANLDIWLTPDNVPVRLTMNLAGKDEAGQKMSMKLEMNIKDINDPSIEIEPPV